MHLQDTTNPEKHQQVLTAIILSFLDSSTKILLSKDEKWLIRDVHSKSIRMYMQGRRYASARQDLVDAGLLKVYHQYLKGQFTKTYWINVEKVVEIFGGSLTGISRKLEDIRVAAGRGPMRNRVDKRVSLVSWQVKEILHRDYREKYRKRCYEILQNRETGDFYFLDATSEKLHRVQTHSAKWDSGWKCWAGIEKLRQYMTRGQAFVYKGSSGNTLHVYSKGTGIETLVEKKHREARRKDMLDILKVCMGINVLTRSDENGREYSILSLCRKAIRSAVCLNSFETVSLDIKKAQPRLLCKMLEQEIETFAKERGKEGEETKGFLNVAHAELEDFKSYLIRDTFYEDFARMLNFPVANRSKGELKRSVFIFLFSPVEKISDLLRRFAEPFPILSHVLYRIKSRLEPRDFALTLQAWETIVMEKVISRMNEVGIDTIRIHDEVIIEERKLAKAWEIWKEVMDEKFGDKIY